MALPKIEDALYQRVLATRSIKRSPLRKVDNLARSSFDVLGEKSVRSSLSNFMSAPVNCLVEQVSVTDSPEAARVAVCNEVRAFDVLVVFGVL